MIRRFAYDAFRTGIRRNVQVEWPEGHPLELVTDTLLAALGACERDRPLAIVPGPRGALQVRDRDTGDDVGLLTPIGPVSR